MKLIDIKVVISYCIPVNFADLQQAEYIRTVSPCQTSSENRIYLAAAWRPCRKWHPDFQKLVQFPSRSAAYEVASAVSGRDGQTLRLRSAATQQ